MTQSMLPAPAMKISECVHSLWILLQQKNKCLWDLSYITGHLRNRLIGGTDHKACFVNGVNFKEVYLAKTFRIPEDLILHFRILVLFE